MIKNFMVIAVPNISSNIYLNCNLVGLLEKYKKIYFTTIIAFIPWVCYICKKSGKMSPWTCIAIFYSSGLFHYLPGTL